MSTTSGVGTYYGHQLSERFVLTDLLKDQGYDSEGDGYEANSVIERLPMTLAAAHGSRYPWSGYWDSDGKWID